MKHTFIEAEVPISCFFRSVRVSVSTCNLQISQGTGSHSSKNFSPTNILTVHSFLEALPTPDLLRLSQSSSSGGEVSIFPVFASRIRTKTFDVCIARYCKNLRVAGSLRLIFAHMKFRTSKIAWVRRNWPLEEPLLRLKASSWASWNWWYGMKPCEFLISAS